MSDKPADTCPPFIVAGGTNDEAHRVSRALRELALELHDVEIVHVGLEPGSRERALLDGLDRLAGRLSDPLRYRYEIVNYADAAYAVQQHRFPEYRVPRGQRRGPVPEQFQPRTPGRRGRR